MPPSQGLLLQVGPQVNIFTTLLMLEGSACSFGGLFCRFVYVFLSQAGIPYVTLYSAMTLLLLFH